MIKIQMQGVNTPSLYKLTKKDNFKDACIELVYRSHPYLRDKDLISFEENGSCVTLKFEGDVAKM